MSLWGNWKCSQCGKEWRGGIGWFEDKNGNPDPAPNQNRIQDRIDKVCGCKKKLTKKDQLEAKILSFTGTKEK